MSLFKLILTLPSSAETREPKVLIRSAAPCPVFENGVKERGLGSTLSKSSVSESGGSRRVDFYQTMYHDSPVRPCEVPTFDAKWKRTAQGEPRALRRHSGPWARRKASL